MMARVSLGPGPRHRPYLDPVSPELQAQPLVTKGPVETVLEWRRPAQPPPWSPRCPRATEGRLDPNLPRAQGLLSREGTEPSAPHDEQESADPPSWF